MYKHTSCHAYIIYIFCAPLWQCRRGKWAWKVDWARVEMEVSGCGSSIFWRHPSVISNFACAIFMHATRRKREQCFRERDGMSMQLLIKMQRSCSHTSLFFLFSLSVFAFVDTPLRLPPIKDKIVCTEKKY